MKVTDESIRRLHELPVFTVAHVIALEGTESTRHVLVMHKDGTDTRYDNDGSTIQFVEGDEIELVPAAAASPSLLPYADNDDE